MIIDYVMRKVAKETNAGIVKREDQDQDVKKEIVI